MKNRIIKRVYKALAILLALFVCVYLLQRFWAHRDEYFIPEYPRVKITETTDYNTIFQQTGLGKPAVNKLLEQGDFQGILEAQDAFFEPIEAECVPLLGWFTMEDRVVDSNTSLLVDLQPGDIILTVSTHSIGWRHGHAGLVLDSELVLECTTLGQDSVIVNADHWSTYSNYAVLRVKDITPELQEEVVTYAKETLCGVPYHLSAGFIGEKAPEPEQAMFGLQCSYLVWYAWQHFGYDLDSDGGRLVTAYDLLNSELLEVVQIYGMDPRGFL